MVPSNHYWVHLVDLGLMHQAVQDPDMMSHHDLKDHQTTVDMMIDGMMDRRTEDHPDHIRTRGGTKVHLTTGIPAMMDRAPGTTTHYVEDSKALCLVSN